MSKRKRTPRRNLGRYRSGYELDICTGLDAAGHQYDYESAKISYTLECVYTPDVVLPNGIAIELKNGRFDAGDRRKMVAVRNQHPGLDIRLLFKDAGCKIHKRSQTTFAGWATQNGFRWAEGLSVPLEWIQEAPRCQNVPDDGLCARPEAE